MRVKLFSHTDKDGVGCGIVAAHVFGRENVDIEYCDYHNVDEKVMLYINSGLYQRYDLTLITDISITEENAKKIDDVFTNTHRYGGTGDILLLDHHPTATGLNKYHWANVTPVKIREPETEDEQFSSALLTQKTSGTTMLFDYLAGEGLIPEDIKEDLDSFAEQVRRYDTWDWKNVYNDVYPKRLNDLLYIIGREAFFNRFMNSLDLAFTETEELLVSNEEKRIEKYIGQKQKQMQRISITNKKKKHLFWRRKKSEAKLIAGVVFADQYISELGNILAESNPDIDFVIMIDMGNKKVSYRGVKTSKIDLGKFAETLGGGGHPPAAGSQFGSKIHNDVLQSLFLIYSVEQIGEQDV